MRNKIVAAIALLLGIVFLGTGLIELSSQSPESGEGWGGFLWAAVFFYGAYWTWRREQKRKSKQKTAEHHDHKNSE